jgi:hypothetical protein
MKATGSLVLMAKLTAYMHAYNYASIYNCVHVANVAFVQETGFH